MKELELYEILPMVRKDLGKDDISVLELNRWCDKFYENNRDIYLNTCRNDIGHAHGCGFIWWEIRDEGSDILHKQESIICPISGTKISKHPNTVYFEKTKAMIKAIRVDVQHVLKHVDLDNDQRKIRENIMDNLNIEGEEY